MICLSPKTAHGGTFALCFKLLPLIFLMGCTTTKPLTYKIEEWPALGYTHDWSKQEALEFLSQNDRVLRVGARLNDSILNQESDDALKLPFAVIPYMPASFWKAYGALPESKVFVTALLYPEILKGSKIQIGDEITAVQGSSFPSAKEMFRILNRSLATHGAMVEFLFKRDGKEWKETLPLIAGDMGPYHYYLMATSERPLFLHHHNCIFISQQTMKLIENDEELAFFLARKIAHLKLGHYEAANKQKKQAQLKDDLLISAGTSLLYAATQSLAGMSKYPVYTPPPYGVAHELSKEKSKNHILRLTEAQEDEADIYAFQMVYKAGFDPGKALGFWSRRLESQQKKNPALSLDVDKRQIEHLKQAAVPFVELFKQTPLDAPKVTLAKKQKPIIQSVAINGSAPNETVVSLWKAIAARNPVGFLQCVTDSYFEQFGEPLEDARKKRIQVLLSDKIILPPEAYEWVPKESRISGNRAKVAYRIKPAFKDYLIDPKAEKRLYAYLLKKTDYGWKIYGRDETMPSSETWLYTDVVDAFSFLPAEVIKTKMGEGSQH